MILLAAGVVYLEAIEDVENRFGYAGCLDGEQLELDLGPIATNINTSLLLPSWT